MNVTIELSDEQAAALEAQAAAQGLSIGDWLQELAARHVFLSRTRLSHREIVEGMRDLRRRIKPDTISVKDMIKEGRRF